MPFFVSKFGGTSLKDADRFQKTAGIILRCPSIRVVVASAPGKRFPGDEKITDLLMTYALEKDEAVWKSIADRFGEIEKGAGVSAEGALNEIRKKIDLGLGREYAMSRGEYLSAFLLAKLTGFRFLDSYHVIRFKNGAYSEKETECSLRKQIKPDQRYVVPGFYGSDEKGNIRLFPRGGSDITGAVIAKILKADLYENWTDVDGVFDADPSQPNAHKLRFLTYTDMQALSDGGACVLHADSIQPVKDASIPIHVRSSIHPHRQGTLIAEHPRMIDSKWFMGC